MDFTYRRSANLEALESRLLFDVLSFPPSGSLLANDRPQTPVLVDLTNNGLLDIVEPDQLSNTVSIFMNNGNGTFGPDNYIHVGDLPYGVAVGDFSNNSIEDIAVVNRGDNDVQILIGNGNGTFQAPVNYQVGSNPEAIAIGDLDGTGTLDIVTANEGDGTISVLMGNGNGTFQTQQTYTVGSETNPVAVALGNLNNNGLLDIVTADAGSDQVTVFMNNGNETFAAGINDAVAVGAEPVDVVLGDFRNDGILDIVTADEGVGADSVSVLLGNGNGTFQPHVEYNAAPAAETIAIGDMNGDGYLDIVTSSEQNNTLDILEGNGDGTFKPVQVIPDPNDNDPTYTVVGDLTGNGKLDIASSGNSNVNLYFNTTPYAVAPSNSQATQGSFPTYVHLTWIAAPDAVSYQIWRSTTPSSADAIMINGDWTKTHYNDSSAALGVQYYYFVAADNGTEVSVLTQPAAAGFIPLPAPAAFAASQGTFPHHIQLSWNAVANTAGYQVFRNTTNDLSTALRIANGITGTSYNDVTAFSGATIYYWVRAKNAISVGAMSGPATGYLSVFPAPQNVTASQGTSSTQIQVTWAAVTGAQTYQVYEGTKDNFATATKIAGGVTETFFDDTIATPNQTYYYWIIARSTSGLGAPGGPASGFES